MQPKTKMAVLHMAKGRQFCDYAQTQRRWPLVLEHWHRWTDYTAGFQRKQKAELCSGRRGSCSPHGFALALRGRRTPREAMAPMGDEGFGLSTGAFMPPARAESEPGIGRMGHSFAGGLVGE
jgi:hypothetical protein